MQIFINQTDAAVWKSSFVLEICVIVSCRASRLRVDPHLVGADHQGKNVTEGRHQATESHVAVTIVYGLAVRLEVGVRRFVGYGDVFNQGHASEVKGQ